uniref:ITPR interacting domain containing 2 n=1 Tax=Sander lucioperca TaxID=283035 RepID=A0A8D0CP49_SANLU
MEHLSLLQILTCLQSSSDSCDSETTVTSHPSLDVATPLAMDQPAFELPDGREEEAGPDGAAGDDRSSEQVPQYSVHHLPRNKPMETQQDKTREEEKIESGDRIDPEPEPEQEISQKENAFLDDSPLCPPPAPSSPVLSALIRAKQSQLTRGGQRVDPQSADSPQIPGRGRGRGRRGVPMQRSSSLPSSLLSPSRVVSSVRIQFGRGQASCTQPRFSFKYNQEAEGDGDGEEVEEEEGQTNCLSTLIINPASSSGSINQPLRLPTEARIPPKPIPRHLLRSTCSLQSCSPPPDWSPGSPPIPLHSEPSSTVSCPSPSVCYFPDLASTLGPSHSIHPGLAPYVAPGPGPSQGPSSTEMQLRRVLHDIRETVQSLSQVRPLQAARPSHQVPSSLLPFLCQKRQSLNLFRSQMMDLELSIIRQQALVYKHLSPADRMEVEQLQSLRSAVREELQELEQQLEDRLMEVTHHTQHRVYTHNTHNARYTHRTHTSSGTQDILTVFRLRHFNSDN